ncbi:MAG: lyase family protein, partial [Phycisphaerales bacterium]|nr:lyase family protein [Phycisphaerales bacterium]
MAATRTRTDHDSMGMLQVPVGALYGASTQRAVQNFPISGHAVSWEVIHAFALLKRAAAEANRELGKLDAKRTRLIVKACSDIVAGLENPEARPDMMQHFPVDIFQTGSGT